MDPVKIKNALKFAALTGIAIEPILSSTIYYFRNKRRTQKELAKDVVVLAKMNDYLVHLLNRNCVQLDEFDQIVLNELTTQFWESA